ncbi:AEC family transporter [Arcobacteraceae bacterium]|nr:AEC family transporter [Arcobacteraceae bacterium]
MDTLITITSIYLFIFIGFTLKKTFKEEINEKTLILLSIYFLQPILTFWGLTRVSINEDLLYVPIIYLVIILSVLLFLILISRFIFDDEKDKAIFIVSSLIGNTGNLSIPLGIALFGESSVPYTSIINIANIFFIYTIGIYFYAKSSFSIKESIISMLKIPILWFALIALVFNYMEITINTQINLVLQMGAYAAIVVQLIILGVYLSGVRLKNHDYKLSLSVSLVKLIFLPFIGIIFVLSSSLSNEISAILIISLFAPLAVTNVNMSALYNCKPQSVAGVIVMSSFLFLICIYFDLEIVKYIFNY